MYFYQHHIGDFNHATRHLTRVERSLYRDLIELYYDTEKPLISDINKLARRVIAVTQEEKDALEYVLDEFFTLTDEGIGRIAVMLRLKNITIQIALSLELARLPLNLGGNRKNSKR